MTLERLKRPPIVEVVCGFMFDPIEQLDPVSVGAYWQQRRDEFPKHQILPALSAESALIIGGMAPLRTWLVSSDDVLVLQLQADRFYLNWRKGAEEYPQFSDHDGKTGLGTRAMNEFGLFAEFVSEFLGVQPKPNRIEVAKIDHLIEGVHWSSFAGLSEALPMLGTFASISKAENPLVGLRFSEELEGGGLTVAIDTAVARDGSRRLLKIESRVTRLVTDDALVALADANSLLNETFETMIPREQRDLLFGGGS